MRPDARPFRQGAMNRGATRHRARYGERDARPQAITPPVGFRSRGLR
ncbi:hypothetical protein NMD1_01543 [Novosphingobium sp. MD-1]|nr:hypothetical protein NMD1_01543 [Novosphingobium sp. MD-1]